MELFSIRIQRTFQLVSTYMEFNKVLDTFSNHSTTIINYFEERLTNASAESFNAKIKAFRSQLRGVADLKFFMFRLARLYA